MWVKVRACIASYNTSNPPCEALPTGEGQADVQHPRLHHTTRVRHDPHEERRRDVEQDAAGEEELAHERLAQLDDDGLSRRRHEAMKGHTRPYDGWREKGTDRQRQGKADDGQTVNRRGRTEQTLRRPRRNSQRRSEIQDRHSREGSGRNWY